MSGRRCGTFASAVNGRLATGLMTVLLIAPPMRAATFRAPLLPGDDAPATPGLAHILEAMATLPPIGSPFELTDLEWHFGIGDPSEGRNPPYACKPALTETVHAPHRVLRPDTPLWFEATMDASEPMILRVWGDDGVQVFVDGRRVRSIANQLFPLPAGNDQTLTVRVVNNAMSGSLRSVERASAVRYQAWRSETGLRDRVRHLASKLARLQVSDPAALAPVTSAVLAAVRAPSSATVTAAEQSLERWPIFRVAPFLQEPVAGGMTVVWETDAAGTATFEWTVAPPDSTDVPSLPWAHAQPVASDDGLFEVRVHDLPPAHTVFYRIRQEELTSEVFSFVTAATSGGFDFTVWADSQGGWATFGRLIQHMDTQPPAFSVGVGDLVNTGSLSAPWLSFYAAIHPLAARRPFFLVPGNHDYDGYYDDFVPLLYHRYARNQRLGGEHNNFFAWTWQNARFVALDPNENFPVSLPVDGEQYRCLMAEVQSEAWRAADWRFVFVHQPCYAQGWSGYHGDQRIRDLLDSLAVQCGIDFVVAGHAHNYERLTIAHAGGRTHHVVVGGAGGRLEPAPGSVFPVMDRVIKTHHYGRFRVEGPRVDFEMIDASGTTRDHFTATR